MSRSPEALETIAVNLVDELAGNGGAADVSLIIPYTRFASGKALIEVAKELSVQLDGPSKIDGG